MFDLIMKTPLVIDCGDKVETNLTTFFLRNEMEEDEREAIMTALESEGEYHGGGGAAAEWTLRIVGDDNVQNAKDKTRR